MWSRRRRRRRRSEARSGGWLTLGSVDGGDCGMSGRGCRRRGWSRAMNAFCGVLSFNGNNRGIRR